jgi:hypothetical protein
VIADGDHTREAVNRLHSGLTLVLPVHLAAQRDPALLDRDLDLVLREERRPLQRALRGVGNLAIGAPARAGKPDIDSTARAFTPETR